MLPLLLVMRYLRIGELNMKHNHDFNFIGGDIDQHPINLNYVESFYYEPQNYQIVFLMASRNSIKWKWNPKQNEVKVSVDGSSQNWDWHHAWGKDITSHIYKQLLKFTAQNPYNGSSLLFAPLKTDHSKPEQNNEKHPPHPETNPF